jgi:PPOX class probable F420-dependent enzyme
MLFDGKNFAVLSTLEPDGRPHSIVVRVKRDGEDIVLALPKGRRKTADLNRDPRAAVVIFDAANPYESAQVPGTASIEDDPDGMLIDKVSHKYTGGPYPGFGGPNPQ